MKRIILGTVAAVSLMAGPALAAEPTVRELTVTADMADLETANASRYYPHISGDLSAAIYDRVTLDDDPNGYVVDVKLGSVSLDGDTNLPDTAEFNQMEGVVTISSPNTNAPLVSYPVQIVANSGGAAVPAGYVAVNPSTDDFYTAMLNGFAEVVSEKMPEAMREAGSR